jgi:TATA-binding protein-associated factor Taf7
VALNALIDQGDEHIRRVFQLYEADKDVYKLIDSLKLGHEDQGEDDDEEETREEEEDDDEDEEEEEEEEEEVDDDKEEEEEGEDVEARFAKVVQSMTLSSLETGIWMPLKSSIY